MSSIEFLTHEQMYELTAARTKAGQLAVLSKNGIRHTVKRNGWPCVTTSALIDSKQVQSAVPTTWQPRKAL